MFKTIKSLFTNQYDQFDDLGLTLGEIFEQHNHMFAESLGLHTDKDYTDDLKDQNEEI